MALPAQFEQAVIEALGVRLAERAAMLGQAHQHSYRLDSGGFREGRHKALHRAFASRCTVVKDLPRQV